MRHLHSDDVIDLAEGTRPESSAPHLRSCEACRRQLTELRAMMSAATQAEVPEPSPLFWDHFSARVRDAVAAEGAPRRAALSGLSGLPGLSGWSWSSVLMPLSVGGCAAVLVAAALMFGSSHMPGHRPGLATPPSVSPGPAASIADAAPMAEPADDPSLDLVANLAAQVDWEGAGDIGIGLRAHEDVADKAVSQLSDGERRELRRLLQEELSHPGN